MKFQPGIAIIIALFIPFNLFAEESISCDASCGSGYRMVSYADGNSVSCACVAEGQMEPTVPDPTVVEGPVVQDTE